MPDIRKRELEFLNGEVQSWVDGEIITSEQGEKILGLYGLKKDSLRMILFYAGCVLLLLGGVSFVAAHWHELPKILRVCVLVGFYLVSLIAYYFAGLSETRTGRSFLLLSSVIFGSSIYLITRMYNYKLEYESVLGWWGMYTMIAALLSRDSWQVYLAQAISLLYLIAINAVDIFALEFLNTARLSIIEFFAPVNAFALILALWVLWKIIDGRTIFNVNVFLSLLLLASRMSLCFGGTWTLIILAVVGAVMSFISGWHDTETAGILMLGMFGMLLTWPDFWRGEFFTQSIFGFSGSTFWPVVNALIVAVLMLTNIYRGHYALGIVFCVLLASRYFFDRLFGYMPKAWGFTLMGIAFLIAGLFFGRIKRLLKHKEEE